MTIDGKMIYEGTQNNIDLKFISSGIYLIKITTNKRVVTKKIVNNG